MEFTPEKILRYLENYGKALCLLPLNRNSNKILSIMNQIGFYFSIANMLSLISCIFVTAYLKSSEYILVTKLVGLTMLYFEVLSNIVIWRAKKSELENLCQEAYKFIQCTEIKKQRIIQKYIARYKYFYVFQIAFAIILFPIRIIIAPLLQSVKLPFAIWYPFPIKPFTLTHFSVFILQLVNTIHCSSQIIFSLLVAIIFLHVSMKLEILAQDLQEVKNNNQLISCILRHQDCIKSVHHINRVFGIIIVKAYFFLGLAVIFATIPFIYDLNFFTMFRAGFTIIICLLCTYIYNGAADDLYEMSQSITVALYGLKWNDELMEMRKSVLIMMCRAQKPLIISPLDGFMPALNRKIYTLFLSYLLSYIMTLRAIVSSH